MRVHKTYRQMKMYNDPTLNPYLYQKSAVGEGGAPTAEVLQAAWRRFWPNPR